MTDANNYYNTSIAKELFYKVSFVPCTQTTPQGTMNLLYILKELDNNNNY